MIDVSRALLLWMLAVVLMVGGPSPAAAAASGAAQLYEDAESRFSAGDYEGALLLLKSALQAAPKDISARYLAGRTYLRLGDGAAAEKELRRARAGGADLNLILKPLGTAYLMQGKYRDLLEEVTVERVGGGRRGDIHLLRGRALLGLEDKDGAQAEFQQARSASPASAEPLLGLAQVSLRRGEIDGAAGLLLTASELDPNDASVWRTRAETARLRGHDDKALEFYDRAIELQPRMVAARIGRAATRIDAGRDGEALADVDVVREILPHDPQAGYLYALIKARAGDQAAAAEALGEVDKALAALDPEFLGNHAPSLYLFGVIAHRQGRDEEAATHLQRFISLRPRHPGARKLLGEIQLARGEPRAAVDTLESATSLTPDDVDLLVLLGSAYLRAHRPVPAETVLSRALRLAPKRRDVVRQIALARAANGHPVEARAVLEAALARDPQNFEAGIMLGDLMLREGRAEAALGVAGRLFKLRPREPALFDLAGRAQMRRERVMLAQRAFEQALALDPDYLPARYHLAELAGRRGFFAQARARYQQIVSDHPGEARAMAALGQLAEVDDDIDQAIEWLEKVRASDAREVGPLLRLADIYLSRGDNDKAMEVVQDLEGMRPEDPGILFARARLELVTRHGKQARSTLRRMSRVAGFSAPWLERAGRLQRRAGDIKGARWSLGKAVEADPAYIPARQALINLEIDAGRYEVALDLARALNTEFPNSTVGEALIGDALLRLGRAEEAVATLEQGLAREDRAPLAVRLYRARVAAGQAREGLAGLEAWLQRHPGDHAVERVLATGYLEAGDRDNARRRHEALLKVTPGDAALLNNLAWLYLESGDQRALSTAESALKVAPEDAASLDTLGWVLVRSGDTERGLKLLRQAYVRSAREPVVRYHLGVALNDIGRVAEARRHLRAALRDGRPFAGREEASALLDRLGDG